MSRNSGLGFKGGIVSAKFFYLFILIGAGYLLFSNTNNLEHIWSQTIIQVSVNVAQKDESINNPDAQFVSSNSPPGRQNDAQCFCMLTCDV